jgi:hypothetical protein
MNRFFEQGRIQRIVELSLRLVMPVTCAGTFALYVVDTNWYWTVVARLPEPIASAIYLHMASARSLLIDSTSLAEDQAKFYSPWFAAFCIGFLGWTFGAVFRSNLARKPDV